MCLASRFSRLASSTNLFMSYLGRPARTNPHSWPTEGTARTRSTTTRGRSPQLVRTASLLRVVGHVVAGRQCCPMLDAWRWSRRRR
jgi:hypothetical protein